MDGQKNKYQNVKIVAVMALSLIPTQVFANGALPSYMRAKNCQMGGAGVAAPLDSTSGNINPALMANVGRDATLQPLLVLQKEKVDTSHAHLTAGTPLPPQIGPQINKIKVYAAGYSGFNYVLNPEWSVGISTSGGGNNARYNKSIVSPVLSAPRKLHNMAALASNTLAYKPTCNETYGASLIVGYLQMKNNLTQFPSGIPTKGAEKTDWALGIGGRLGGQWEARVSLMLGLAASTPIIFQRLKKYRDVIKHKPQLPPMVTGGLAWHITKETDLLFGLEGDFWHASPAFGKKPPSAQVWKNTLTHKFGAQHQLDGCLKDYQVRAGYNYARSPIPKNEVLFNALSEVITVSEHILTGGISYYVNKGATLDLGCAYMFPSKITDNGKGVAGPNTKGVFVKASAFVITLGLI